MHTMTFSERAQTLEDEFFHRVDRQLLDKLRRELSEQQAKAALQSASGIADDKLLTELIRIGVRPETLAAVSLIPLVAVAWADGKLDAEERRQVLAAEREAGITDEAPSHQLLEQWLAERPDVDLLSTWKHYLSTLRGKLTPTSGQSLAEEILQRARAVAKAAGGYLTYGSVSPSEKRVLSELKATLSSN